MGRWTPCATAAMPSRARWSWSTRLHALVTRTWSEDVERAPQLMRLLGLRSRVETPEPLDALGAEG